MKAITVTQLIKIKRISSFLDSFINFDKIKDQKFEMAETRGHERLHKNYMMLGTAIDYYVRFNLAKKLKIPQYSIIADKSLKAMKNELLDFTDKLDNDIYNAIITLIDKYKDFKTPERQFPFLNLAMVDGFYRSGFFDKYSFMNHLSSFMECKKDPKRCSYLIRDFEFVRQNVKKLLFNLDLKKPINLNPTLGHLITSDFIIKGDADLINEDTLFEIKTSIKDNIQRDHIRQLLVYLWLLKRHNITWDIKYIQIINTRAKNTFKIDLNYILNVDTNTFLNQFEKFIKDWIYEIQ